MKKIKKFLGLIAIAAVMGFGFTACDGDDDSGGSPCTANCKKIGDAGEAGGKIIYHNHAGFTVTGTEPFTAYYLEAAPSNQATYDSVTFGGGLTWCSCSYNNPCDVKSAMGTEIGTGKANTAAIIAAHTADTKNNNAAKACADYNGGSKNDWFLPSKDELNEMYKARTHLGISSKRFWSSLQGDYTSEHACIHDFEYGVQDYIYKPAISDVRAVRAF